MKHQRKIEKSKNRILDTADKLLDMINGVLDDGDLRELVTSKTMIKQFSSALKDIRDITDIYADSREQEARIVKLEKQIDGDDGENEVKVVIGGDGEWSE